MLAQYRIDSPGCTVKIKREMLMEEICSSSTFCLMENSVYRASWSQLDLPKEGKGYRRVAKQKSS